MIRDDQVYLALIVDALEQITTYTIGMDDEALGRTAWYRTLSYGSSKLSARQPRIFRLVFGKVTPACRGRISPVSVTN